MIALNLLKYLNLQIKKLMENFNAPSIHNKYVNPEMNVKTFAIQMDFVWEKKYSINIYLFFECYCKRGFSGTECNEECPFYQYDGQCL